MRTVALAVDLGGTKVETALVDDGGAILTGSRHRHPTGFHSSSSDLQTAVARVIFESLAVLPADAVLAGAGIGSAGPINRVFESVSPINLPSWREFPLAAFVRQRLPPGAPAVLRLDGASLALAEEWVGASQGVANSLGITVSTGVGGGLIVDGRLLSGGTGNAGHIGQIHVADRASGESLRLRTLEELASGPHAVAWAQGHGWQGARGEDLAVGYATGDAIATAAVRRSASAVGEAIASVVTLLDLDLVVIGGGFSRVSPDYLDLVRAAAAGSAALRYASRVEVVSSALSDQGPLIGAAALIHRAALLEGSGREGAPRGL